MARSVNLTVRITPELDAEITAYLERYGMAKTELVERAIVAALPVAPQALGKFSPTAMLKRLRAVEALVAAHETRLADLHLGKQAT